LGLEASERRRLLTDIKGEHRLVTVVFADLTSSVARTGDLHPEEAAMLVNSLLETMVDTLIRYGGRIDRFLGDGVLAVFGIPETHEDDPERAVRAALDIHERASEIGLGATVGVNTGRVYFGPVGSSLHEELTVMGPVVNLAARLQGTASEGQVMVGRATRDHVFAAFELTPVILDIKGIDEPVEAFVAERLLDHPDKVRGIEGLAAPIIGREAELAKLEAALAAGGRFVSLVGEAGVGKSRLAAEFHRRVIGSGFRWLEGRCLELSRGVGYGPIRDLLRRCLGEEASLDAVRSVTGPQLDDAWMVEMAPFLLDLVSDGARAAPRVRNATPAQRKAMTISAVGDFLAAIAGQGPTVIFIDDLHWSDALSIELLAEVFPRISALPVMELGTYRPEGSSQIDEMLERIAEFNPELIDSHLVPALSSAEARQMVMALLAIDGLPHDLERLILDRAEGNPFFVEEIIRSLIQQGIVYRAGDSWMAADGAADVEVPESVQAVVMSRVDRLDPAVRRCAQIASVLGRTFTLPLLGAMAGSEARERLQILAGAGLLRQTRVAPIEEYSFAHALTQEGVYETLLPSRRAELHEQAGGVFERLLPAEPERRAYHFERSRNVRRAVDSLLAAGEKAMDAYLTEAAFDYLERGLERVEALPPEEQALPASQFRERRGEMLERLARYDEARAEFEAALDLRDHTPVESAALYRLIGRTYRLEYNMAEAHAAYDRAEATLDASPQRDSTEFHRSWIDLQHERAFALYFGGRAAELSAHSAHTGPVVEAHGTPRQQVDFLLAQPLAMFRARRYAIPPEDIEVAARTLQLAEEAGDVGQIATARFMTGFASLWGDQLETAERLLGLAVRDADRIGDVMLGTRARVYFAVALRRLGRVDGAEQGALSALDVARSLDATDYCGHAAATLCWVAWRRGDVKGARRWAIEAVDSWTEVKDGEDAWLQCEFAWMVVWPMVAMALDAADLGEAIRYLDYLQAPWERAMPDDLAAAVAAAHDEPRMRCALDLARRHRLL
jgi:class 3 adenylate cyclase/tetratricopeptide (TPR) repeat protein